MPALKLLMYGIFFFGISCGVAKKTNSTVQYVDQNNNRYIVTETTFKYIPITEKESSSGTYNGGEPVSKIITSENFSELTQIAEELISSAPKNDRREMMTSILSISKNGVIESVTLKKGKKRSSFEALLHELKQPSE